MLLWQCHRLFLISWVTVGHEIKSEAGVCKNGERGEILSSAPYNAI